MIWWLVGGATLVLLIVIAVRAVGGEDRKTISWWAARNGFRYTQGTGRLLDHLPGAPFDRGTSRDLHDVLTGSIADRPALILQFSWFRLPTGGGPSGLHSGICSVAVLELPAPVPELFVRKETSRDLGRDLQLESQEFNDAFRITGAHDRFSYDVLNPRAMALLLTKPHYAVRIAGSTLAVWRDGALTGAMELAEVRDFAATLYGLIPAFVYTAGYPAVPTDKLSEIPADDLGEPAVNTVHLMQHVEHRGHQVERYEHARKLWGVTETAVSAKISVDTEWPVLMIAAKKIASERGRQPRFDDGVESGNPRFDSVFACGTPRPDFALKVLTSEFTELLLDRPANTCVIFQSELLTPEDDGVPERTVRGGIWVSAVGELSDQRLADQVTELACDLLEALPADVLDYHVGAPLPPPPVGGYPNQLPGYFVRSVDRV